jgi:type IV pilus assembly protein PilY1
MNGTLVSGNDPSTRGNIGRSVMRNAITTYRSAFNWGLMTYGMTGAPGLYNTYAYYLGDNAGMVFTDDCVGFVAGNPPTVGISASNGNRRCIANPQPFVGGSFVTYDQTGDDANIQDVLYTTGVYTGLWGLTAGAGTSYKIYKTHNIGGAWAASDFGGSQGTWSFTPTDAGYLSNNPPITRQVYTPRGWGYNQDITGDGTLNEQVAVDSAAHYSTLQSKLASETNGATGEVKNGALFTPLRGSLQSSKTYFSTSLSSKTSPVKYACQQNFVMLVTDGMPTGKTDGNLYSAADRANTCTWSTATNSCTAGSFGTAATDAISATNALRTTSVTGYTSTNKDGTGAITGKYDVQTYVVALGDTVANADALSVMNAMAFNGGTGEAIPANNAVAFQNAITKIADDITSKVGSSAAVAVANAHITASDNASYASTYNSGTWTGDLDSHAVDTSTGVPSATSSWSSGTAATQLDLRTSASRFIATSPDTAGAIGGIQFQPTTAATSTKLSATQQALLNTPPSSVDGAAVLAYLRGDRSGEPTTYRPRAHLLGDTINSEPVLVREPNVDMTDTGYAAFKTSKASRTKMLFQGANDGMLHAFFADTGAESWAFVPNLVMANLNNLSLKAGFNHKYYVDGTPVAADVDFGSSNWHTILVGGLGKGGRGYYALDVTTPNASTESDAASKVLWEFPNSISSSSTRNAVTLNMGYSFGKPVVVKTTAEGWVTLVTSGYNNGTNDGDSGGDGLGHLYVINPQTGDLIRDIATAGCTTTPATSPCGLAQISASVTSTGTVDYVYGGDLMGNVWRFDLTGGSSAAWTVSKFTALVDASNVAQPVTTAPKLTNNAGVRMVLLGTGQYLGTSDVLSTQVQTMYGLKDSLVALPTPLRTNLQQQTITTSGSTRTISNNEVNYAIKSGWYIDLPTTGERVYTQPAVYLNNLVFTSNIPSSTPCEPGGSSWEYVVNSKTGTKAEYALGTVSGIYMGTVLSSAPIIVRLPNGKYVSIVHTTGLATTPPSGFGDGSSTSTCATASGCTNSTGMASPSFTNATIKRTWRQLYLY